MGVHEQERGFTLFGLLLALGVAMGMMAGLVTAYKVQETSTKEKSTLKQLASIAKAAKEDCITRGGTYAVSYSDLRSRYPQLPVVSPFNLPYTLGGGRYRAQVSTQVPSGYFSPKIQHGEFLFTSSAGTPASLTVRLPWGTASESPSVMDRVMFTDKNSFSGTRPWPW